MAGTVLIVQGADAALEIVEMALFESEAMETVDAGMAYERLVTGFIRGPWPPGLVKTGAARR